MHEELLSHVQRATPSAMQILGVAGILQGNLRWEEKTGPFSTWDCQRSWPVLPFLSFFSPLLYRLRSGTIPGFCCRNDVPALWFSISSPFLIPGIEQSGPC